MDKQTLLKLQNNPHYTLSDKQRKELNDILAQENKKPMIEFGSPDLHDNDFETTRNKRVSKKKVKK